MTIQLTIEQSDNRLIEIKNLISSDVSRNSDQGVGTKKLKS